MSHTRCSTSSTVVVVLDFITRRLFVVPFGRSISCNRQWVTSNGSNRNVLLTVLLSFRSFYPSMVHRRSYWTSLETSFWLFESAESSTREQKKIYIGHSILGWYVHLFLTVVPRFLKLSSILKQGSTFNICHEFDDLDRKELSSVSCISKGISPKNVSRLLECWKQTGIHCH